MLANGSIPMLPSTKPVEPRLTAAADLIAHPDDRRNPAAPTAPMASAGESTAPTKSKNPKTRDEPQPDQDHAERLGSPPPAEAAAPAAAVVAPYAPAVAVNAETTAANAVAANVSIAAADDASSASLVKSNLAKRPTARNDSEGAREPSTPVASPDDDDLDVDSQTPNHASGSSPPSSGSTTISVEASTTEARAPDGPAQIEERAAPPTPRVRVSSDTPTAAAAPRALDAPFVRDSEDNSRSTINPNPVASASRADDVAPPTSSLALPPPSSRPASYAAASAAKPRAGAVDIGAGARAAPTEKVVGKPKVVEAPENSGADADPGPDGMDVDEDEEQQCLSARLDVPISSQRLTSQAHEMAGFASRKPQKYAETGPSAPVGKAVNRDEYIEEVVERRSTTKERDGKGRQSETQSTLDGEDNLAVMERAIAEKERAKADAASAAAAAARQRKACADAHKDKSDAALPSPSSVLEDPPAGEGWDEHGVDLSKITNDAIRTAQCEAWTAKLRQEASAIRAGDHPEVLRRSVLTVSGSKRRLEASDRNAKRQHEIAEELFRREVKSIEDTYEAAVEQTRERLLAELNEEIRRSKSRLEGCKEVENRMNTRHTRGNAKGAIEDPWLAQTTGSKTNGNSKRPLCPISLALDDDELTEDIEYLRYSGQGGDNGGPRGNGDEDGSGDGGAANTSGYGGGYDMSPSVSGRARRPPSWRRDE